MEKYAEMVVAAAIAERVYKNNDKELFHAYRILQMVADNPIIALQEDNYDYATVAVLHDVVEDGYATWEELFAAGISDKNYSSLFTLTHMDYMSYKEYIDGIITSNDKVAITVKIYDLIDHFNPALIATHPTNKTRKYAKALERLTLKLKEM